MGTKRGKGVSVMLDADIVIALKQMQSMVIERMNQSGVYGMAASPTLGYLARQLLRKHLSMPGDKTDKPTLR